MSGNNNRLTSCTFTGNSAVSLLNFGNLVFFLCVLTLIRSVELVFDSER